jgi:predicted nucleotidyltransferase
MGVLGLSEALQAAINVRLPENVDVQVAALPALAVLKVAAWYDRQHESPGKDAGDLWLLLRSYASAGNEDRIYEGHVRVLESSGFDPDLAGAWLMGADALRVMQLGPEPSQAIAVLRRILDPEVDVDGPLRLLGQMPIGDKDRQLALLRAFRAGLLGVSTP